MAEEPYSNSPVIPGADSVRQHAVTRSLMIRSRDSLDQIVPMVYDELRRIASRHVRRTRDAAHPDGTLATTALVNEAYLKLVDQSQVQWADRAHFMALASVAMRQILIGRARARARSKRGGGVVDEMFETDAIAHEDSPARLLEINDALDRLALIEPRLARVVECRFFGGLSDEEIAESMAVTVRTVQRDWQKARTLLRQAMAE